ncbi:MAG: CPBP family intramembrane metalloprotease [Clostridia bacterium]|nr:CPBP family intramembrane metalloprotease [Clostridia bacterium]
MKNKNIFKINTIYFVAITLVAIIFLFGYSGLLKNDFLTSFLIQIVVMFAIPLFMYSFIMKKNLKESFADAGLKKISAKMLAISILLGIVLYFINSFVADTFAGIIALFGYESLSSTSTVTFNYGLLFKEFILSCILPGFCEEFLHRGIMLHAAKKHANTKFCLVISSILFGLTHLNIRQFFYAAILGFLMGYVTLVADSIIPSIIIHFMNNFLSTYFYYGTYLNWPFAKFINYVTNIFMSDIFIFISTSAVAVILLLWLYSYLTKVILKERAKNEMHNIVKALQMDKLSLIQAQIKINHVNQLLKEKTIKESIKPKSNLLDKVLLISSIVLGTILTISSFIWGVI